MNFTNFEYNSTRIDAALYNRLHKCWCILQLFCLFNGVYPLMLHTSPLEALDVIVIKHLCRLKLVLTDVLGDRNGLDKDSVQPGTGGADVSSTAEGCRPYQAISHCNEILQ